MYFGFISCPRSAIRSDFFEIPPGGQGSKGDPKFFEFSRTTRVRTVKPPPKTDPYRQK